MKTTVLLLLTCFAAVGCNGDIEPVDSGTTDGGSDNGLYSLTLSNNNLNLTEGTGISVDVQVQRSSGYDGQVALALTGASPNDTDKIWWQFSDPEISGTETTSRLTINMNYGPLPAQREARTLRIVGTDGRNQSVAALNVETVPTTRPDVYLLVGQSNMVGFSEDDSKQAAPGQPDAPMENIKQLNVTGNDGEHFNTFNSFTSINSIAVTDQLFTPALDPLHDGYDSGIQGKEGARIGMGLSFAKQAINNTQAQIILVPAAWSDTGFCTRTRTLFEGELGWNATNPSNPALSGTLLHDRAIARTNLALNESGGILRGILWHQGESDSNDMACAQTYQQNLIAMVRSFRTNIAVDARGPEARGPNANVPFVLGSMSKGGPYITLSEGKTIVDGVHRNIAEVIPFSTFVTNDDLVPPDYPCGEGDCIHFGASSLRIMGQRYYDFLLQAATM